MPPLPPVILLVEDEFDIREALEELLVEEGFRVVGVPDGVGALDWLAAGQRPSLVLLDFIMPRMDGWSFLDRMCEDAALADLPVVAISGSLVTHPLVAVTLRKPFVISELLDTVRRLAR